MTLFAFRGVKSHEWTFYDPILIEEPSILYNNGICEKFPLITLLDRGSPRIMTYVYQGVKDGF